jgi:hypothetical protein
VTSLSDLLFYDSELGELRWKVTRKGRGCVAGTVAGTVNRRKDTSYKHVMVHGKKLLAHRVIWELCFGPIPDGMQIDHIDGNGLNNRIDNLRLVSPSLNQRNRRLSNNNTSGHVCIRPHKSGSFQVQVATKYIGSYPSINEAIAARDAAFKAAGFHPNHGKTQ